MNLRATWKLALLLPLLLAGCKELEVLRILPPAPYTVVTPGGAVKGTLEALLPELARKRVVYVGETHSRYGHHLLQLAVIRGLHARGVDLAIGMEFFQRPFQEWLDAYIEGRISETEMLEKTQWFDRWRFDYRLYRPILRFAREHRIPVVALNVPREITDEVSEKGIDGLKPESRAQLPERIDRSDRAYRERLHQVFTRHEGKREGQFERFLDVQYSWDEGMAQSVADYLKAHPGKQMVVLAGSGHIAWGSGIPSRVARRIDGDYAILLPADGEMKPGMADYLVVTEEKKLSPRPLMGILIDTSGDGILVTGVTRASGAEKAGLRKGDRILAIDGQPVSSYTRLRVSLMDKRPGDRIRVRYQRDSDIGEKELVLGASPH
ncbi:MAG TPA: PDZ domain-containing protein [Thiolapillus brandeum]|uniref:PDZ domain-containing protein n=1 Tax=Thiolapillus brandeum TaxID=1076588 RepID=A0A7C5MZ59_9GAMM|nr:PDZ domain-containing protein [Thiolapillus brandeum]